MGGAKGYGRSLGRVRGIHSEPNSYEQSQGRGQGSQEIHRAPEVWPGTVWVWLNARCLWPWIMGGNRVWACPVVGGVSGRVHSQW